MPSEHEKIKIYIEKFYEYSQSISIPLGSLDSR